MLVALAIFEFIFLMVQVVLVVYKIDGNSVISDWSWFWVMSPTIVVVLASILSIVLVSNTLTAGL